MAIVIGRVALVATIAVAGLAVAPSAGLPSIAGALLAAVAAVLVVALEVAAGRASQPTLLWTLGGGAGGLLVGLAIGVALVPLTGAPGAVARGAAALLGAWVGAITGARRAAELSRAPHGEGSASVLDTSVLVDGRIADIADAGFLHGAVIVPQFVVREIQRLADAGDSLRRARGRRGFDVLEHLRRSPALHLEIADTDFSAIGEVDAKLVALARTRGARLLTNDTALARVARLAGVAVGNLNDLAHAMRPVALPGEAMQVQVVREGKEAGQGVAYLPDGTMVVVEGGKRFIGQPLDVVVTRMLQTAAGRMIFTRPRGEGSGLRDA
jgi:uncharacterized protein YacL